MRHIHSSFLHSLNRLESKHDSIAQKCAVSFSSGWKAVVQRKFQVPTFRIVPPNSRQKPYDASGTKLTMKVIASGGTVEGLTTYVGGFVYEGATPALSFFASPEGRVVKNGSSFEYQYSIADHQGNTRVLFTSATQTPSSYTANMESGTNNDFLNASTNRVNFELYDHTDFSGSTYSYSQKLTGASGQQVGVAKSFKVYPGDKVKIVAYAKYYASSGTSNLSGFATALLTAFNLSAPAGGETGTPSAGVNSWGALVAGGSGNGEGSYPKAFVNLLVFDRNYNYLDVGWDQINGGEQIGETKAAHDTLTQEYTAREEGYIYVYVSNENSTLVEVYFDDVEVTHTKSNLIQGNEYYPFGMQTANSWTREAVTGNNYLANGGTELNQTSQLYDLEFRNFDPVLGRMNQVDPLAAKYASLTPYNYSFNNPIGFSDPSGAEPDDLTVQNPNYQYYYNNGAGASGNYGLSYDDYDPMARLMSGEFQCVRCWDTSNMMGWFMGGGPSLNAASFASQSIRHHVGSVLRGIGAALNSDNGGEVNVNDGSVSLFDEKGAMVKGAEYKFQHGQMTEELAAVLYNYFTPVLASGPNSPPGLDTFFEGTRIIDTNVSHFKRGAAMTIPGVGIFLSRKYWDNQPYDDAIDLLKHEYGHILQAEKLGKEFFYMWVAPLSLHSAGTYGSDHQNTWTERTANYFSMQHFGSKDWNHKNYPIYYPANGANKRDYRVPPFGKMPGLPPWWDKRDNVNRG